MTHKRPSTLIIALLALMLFATPAIAQQATTEIENITGDVAQLRGLEELHPIEVETMTREELREYMIQAYAEEYPEDEQYADEREMLAFGLMDEHIDFGDLAVDLFSEAVAGFYDTETGQMVVVRDAGNQGAFGPNEEVTYAHEIIHALQDQHFDIDAGPLDQEELSDDRSLAVDALVEGDASFGEVLYLVERPELLEAYIAEIEAMEFDSAVLDRTPPLILATVGFPYNEGYYFVEAIYQEGGWDAVNGAYASPPISTEQVLHPEKYLAGEAPIEIEVADFTPALGPEWTVFDTNTFGEFQIRVILEQTSLSEEQRQRAAAGWGGDTYVVAGTESDDAIHWVTEWDTEQDAGEFARAWVLRETERWGVDPAYTDASRVEFQTETGVVRILIDGTRVTYLMAPTVEMLDTIATAPAPIPAASPDASPVASPIATPEATPVR